MAATEFGSGVKTIVLKGAASTKSGCIDFKDHDSSTRLGHIFVQNDTTYGMSIGTSCSGEDGDFIRFHTGTLGSTKMYIKSDGKVGIGETSPDSLLHLRDLTDGGASLSNLISISRRNGGANDAVIQTLHDGSDGISALSLWFGTDESLRLTAGGLVGINQNTPTERLHVVGNAIVTGMIMAGDGTTSNCAYANNGDSHTGMYFPANDNVSLSTGGTQRFLIESNGIVKIGNSVGNYYSNDLVLKCAANAGGFTIAANGTSDANFINFADTENSPGYLAGGIKYRHDTDAFIIRAGHEEKVEISSGGILTVNSGGGLYVRGGTSNRTQDTVCWIDKQNNNDWCLKVEPGTGSSTDYGVYVRINNAGSYAFGVHNLSSWKFRVAGNGTVYSSNTTISQISDRRLKQNIVDANSQWDDIKGLKFKNYQWKDVPGYSDADGKTYLGLISDEVEPVSPNLIDPIAQTKEDMENEVPDPEYKGIKYSIVWMKAVKALQEAQARIETLEAEVAALKSS